MAIEIERRFIVQKDEWKTFAKEAQELQQGYLCTNFEEWLVRVRIIDRKYSVITLKALKEGNTNYEFEYSIPFQDGQSIWDRIKKKLHKTRYFLDFDSHQWVVDCFQGENFPLVIAEVELSSENTWVKQPQWCSSEITGIKKFSNAALAQFPISTWSIEERESFNLL